MILSSKLLNPFSSRGTCLSDYIFRLNAFVTLSPFSTFSPVLSPLGFRQFFLLLILL